MTREEAIETLKTENCYECSYGCGETINCPAEDCPLPEAVKMAIQALEQEPCEDAISREPFTDSTICEGISCNECSFNRKDKGGCILEERVMRLPSIQPQPKTGHWIEEETYMECPNCHDIWHYEENQTERFKFCPTCGGRIE